DLRRLPPRDLLRHRLQHYVLYFHRPLHRGPRISFHALHGLPSSPPAKRTYHVLSQPDISCATDTGHSITLTNPTVPSILLQYSSFKQITDDISDARVYGGIHFRTDQEAGADLGRAVGTAVYKNNLRPVHNGD